MSNVNAPMGPAGAHYLVTPDDGNDLPNGECAALWIGGAGDVCLIDAAGLSVTFTGVPAGTYLLSRAKRVKATLTTATNIIALYP